MDVGFKLFGILLHEGNLPPSWLGINLQRSIMLGGNMHAIQWDTNNDGTTITHVSMFLYIK